MESLFHSRASASCKCFVHGIQANFGQHQIGYSTGNRNLEERFQAAGNTRYCEPSGNNDYSEFHTACDFHYEFPKIYNKTLGNCLVFDIVYYKCSIDITS